MENIIAEVGKTYKMTMTVRGSKAGALHSKLGDWDNGDYPNIPFTTEWKEVTVDYKAVVSGNFFMLQCGDFVGDIYIKNIKFEGYMGKTIPLTQQERHDTLVYAMDKWIKGMMEACAGKVKAWDLVNEAISGSGDDGSGNYVLQGYNPNGNPDATWDVGGENFFWQDYMGSLEYVRQACRLARKYGPEDMVLFINDYNLESDWDQNKKLKSLINWIKKWEADGVTRIDGIGTQMHISYYENSYTQNSKKNAISNMFRLMAATGKWVRVSEMDMGYYDASGKAVPTNKMTETQHKNMADFYEWIIKEYFRLVPPAQQWGICQWCTNDSPSGSSWRADTPVGIWDINNYRKHVYAGFVRGLFGEEPTETGIDGISDSNTTDVSKGIYDLSGRKLNVRCLKKGLYIVNGTLFYN
jgi:GH35 family endo-1,4-beta-xylanase